MSKKPRQPGQTINTGKLDDIVAKAHQEREKREAGYREQSLRIHPWICGRCSREFTRTNLHELTVHHKDHNHDNNPPDGSNWENLCLYCHDNEHQKYEEHIKGYGYGNDKKEDQGATHQPFADLASLLKKGDS